jgi:hypothetical protein
MHVYGENITGSLQGVGRIIMAVQNWKTFVGCSERSVAPPSLSIFKGVTP